MKNHPVNMGRATDFIRVGMMGSPARPVSGQGIASAANDVEVAHFDSHHLDTHHLDTHHLDTHHWD